MTQHFFPRDGFIAVVIPCFNVRRHVLDVINKIGPECFRIFIIDDACPESTGKFVEENSQDTRVKVIYHAKNQGVGGAVMTGYLAAIRDGADVIVKVDGDGQMTPTLIPQFVKPIISGEADYTKGNRFVDLEMLRAMPRIRLIGNAVLSFMAKISTGYWDIFDPTNGFTAIHSRVAAHLPFNKISHRYFFETDVLFRLNTLHAVVLDIPMVAQYGNEVSGLRINKIIGEFFLKHLRNSLKRVFYNYYLRDLSLASIELPLGLFFISFGVLYGFWHWFYSVQAGVSTPAGTVMLSALPILLGLQFVLAFFGQDISSVPRYPLHKKLSKM